MRLNWVCMDRIDDFVNLVKSRRMFGERFVMIHGGGSEKIIGRGHWIRCCGRRGMLTKVE